MDVVAAVDISDGNFDEWFDFFKSYEPRRHEFVADEVTIKDIDGLTELSSSQFLLDGEARLGITVELSEKLP
jgi:hypothetical protein